VDCHHATLTLANFLLGGGKGKSANPNISEIGKNEGQFLEVQLQGHLTSQKG
jgi:hypothetical protein